MTPDVSIKTVILHVSSMSHDFPAAFGAKVKAAGGKFSEIRSPRVSHRYVTLPFSERELIDQIMQRYALGSNKTMVVDALSSDTLDLDRMRSVLNKHMAVYKWDKQSGLSASAFLDHSFSKRLADTDWSSELELWSRLDREAAERKKAFDFGNQIADLRERIIAEAVRIAEGANDIDPLKELAAEYADVCAAAGVAIKRVDAGEPMPSVSPKL